MSPEAFNSGIRNRLLAALDPGDPALLTPHLVSSRLRQGVVLHEAGDPIEAVYFPKSGMIALVAVMRAGNGIETATIGREGAVGVSVGRPGGIGTARAVVQRDGDFLHVPMGIFRGAVEASPVLRSIIARYSDVQMMLVRQVAGCNALHAVSSRLCRWLLQTRDRCDDDRVPLTQEFLSEMLGVQRTSVTALARELQDSNLIRYRRGVVEIVDRPGLEHRACECYATARDRIEQVFSESGK